MEISSNKSETDLPVLPQVLHLINEKIDNIISIQAFKHETQNVTFVAMKSTGHLMKFDLSLFRKEDTLQRIDIDPETEIKKRLNQLANLTKIKVDLTSALSAYDEKIKSANGAIYQFHNINKYKRLNQEQIKVHVRIQHDITDSLSNQNGKFLIHITDIAKLLNSSYSILTIISGYTHQSNKLCKNTISYSFPLRDAYSSPMTFDIPFKRILGNIITLSEHSDINFNILFTLRVECLLCLNSLVTSSLRNNQFLKLEKHSILQPYSCITLSLQNIDILHFINESYIGRKPSLKLTRQRVNLTNINLIPISMNFEASLILLRQILHDSKMSYNKVTNISDSKITKQLEWKTMNLKIKLLSTKRIDLGAFLERVFSNLLNGNSDGMQYQEIEEISMVFFDGLQVIVRCGYFNNQ